MYISTRGGQERFSAAEAIKAGLAPDGGLLVPETLPRIDDGFLAELVPLDYHRRATRVLQFFLDDYSPAEIEACVQAAYPETKFDHSAVAPLVALTDSAHVLELWHGPTSAFKDMALQMLPQLLSLALTKTGETAEIVILVATSGDTGKAALEGFRDVEQIRIIVFFPHEGVSEVQRLQMVTQEGRNVTVVAVRGNFDDTQTGVKNIFNDKAFNARLLTRGFKLSSANSINWGRLLPQIVYYFSAYADMVRKDSIQIGQGVNFAVPTGNFGNILAGYYAKQMGLPVNRLICAANSNNVLTEFLRTGVYNRNRDFHKTLSPSMDILISSNLERLLHHATGSDAAKVAGWMSELAESGRYQVDDGCLKAIQAIFWSDWASDEETLGAIQGVFGKYGYLMDTHTAAGWKTCEKYRQATGDSTPTVLLSTASPFKFNQSVFTAVAGHNAPSDRNEFAVLKDLSGLTGWPVPPALEALEGKDIRHKTVCDKQDMPGIVDKLLG
jgi:threonine synthase